MLGSMRETEGMRLIWLSVLRQAVADAYGRAKNDGLSSGEYAVERRRAESWFGTSDFYQVCALAGVDAGWVLRRLPGVRERVETHGRRAMSIDAMKLSA